MCKSRLLALLATAGVLSVTGAAAAQRTTFPGPRYSPPAGFYGPYVTRPIVVFPYAGGIIPVPVYGGTAVPYLYPGTYGRYPVELYGRDANPPAATVRYYAPQQPSSVAVQSPDTLGLDTRAGIKVKLPTPDAEIWFNGVKMKQTGLVREFVTPPLTPGERYRYRVRIVWKDRGIEQIKESEVPIESGQQLTLDYSSHVTAAPPAEKLPAAEKPAKK